MTTTQVRIYGVSDDLVEIEGDIEGADEYPVNSDITTVFTMVAPDGGTALIYVDYRPNGVWSVAISRYEEDYKIPEWNARTVSEDKDCRYSATLILDVPEGTVITRT